VEGKEGRTKKVLSEKKEGCWAAIEIKAVACAHAHEIVMFCSN